jgi:hypothetical protein
MTQFIPTYTLMSGTVFSARKRRFALSGEDSTICTELRIGADFRGQHDTESTQGPKGLNPQVDENR